MHRKKEEYLTSNQENTGFCFGTIKVSRSVSYTHLDVYKRQDYKYVPMRDVREAMYPEKMTTEQLAEALDEIAEAFDPYEDVYKRQPFIKRRIKELHRM